MKHEHTVYRPTTLAVALSVILTLGFIIFAGVQQADAHQPYGGCDEAWQAPRSAGAAHCRSHGWVVRPRVVIGPKGWVQANRLPALSSDEPNFPGYWDAKRMGNGEGRSFVVVGTWENHRLIYVSGFAR